MVDLMGHPGIRSSLKDKLESEIRIGDAERRPDDPTDPLDVRGFFNETEQWLWATNRCLRKWSSTIERFVFDHWATRSHSEF